MGPLENEKRYYFTGNPIMLRDDREGDPGETVAKRYCTFKVKVGQKEYEGKYLPPATINISDVVDSLIEYFPEPQVGTDPLLEIVDTGDLAVWQPKVTMTFQDVTNTFTFYSFKGGVNRQVFRYLNGRDTDIFAERFLACDRNFFMTSRPGGGCVRMMETEMYPLYFLVDNNGDQVELRPDSGIPDGVYSFDDLGPGVYALDLEALRYTIWENGNSIPSVFDVYRSGVFACRIYIERAEAAKDRYRFKFRNSFGVFEIIELCGTLATSPGYEESEESDYERYDPTVAAFVRSRDRIARRQKYSMEYICPDNSRFMYLSDMLGSSEVYLLDQPGGQIRVIPSIEGAKMPVRIEAPTKIEISFEMSDPEDFIMDNIEDLDFAKKPRLFSKEYDKKFN